MNLPSDIKASLRLNAKLSQYCTMQVGGEARFFAEPANEQELLDLIEYAKSERLPYFILGKGSNVIFADEGFPGLVITLLRFKQNEIIFDEEERLVTASSGIHLYRFVTACRNAGFSGAEFLANIPGTVGGALVMNAGFSRHPGQRSEIGDIVHSVHVMNSEGRKETLVRKQVPFAYRSSGLENCIVLSGTFHVWKRSRDFIQSEIDANFKYRNVKQDLQHPSSGSVFKNPPAPHPPAAKLIENAGLKGMRIGQAMISPKHSNYMINLGKAKCRDMIQLMEHVQKTVFEGTGILLEPEVRVVKTV